MQLKTTVKCNKTLKHSDGTESFTKGKTYSGNICNVIENLTVTNNQGEDHRIGSWAKHFTNISKY
jgi:hypothetical protein